MSSELRRDKRVATDLPIGLVLRDGVDGPVLAGPAKGLLNDVSLYGVRFTVPEIHIDQYHIFYSCHDNPSLIIFLEIADPADDDKTFSIPLRPVWFDRILSEESREKPFQVGGEFIIGPGSEQVARLKKIVSQKKQTEGSWLSKFFHGLANQNNSGE